MYVNRWHGALWLDGVQVLDGGYRRARLAGASGCGTVAIEFTPAEFSDPYQVVDGTWVETPAPETVDDEIDPAPWYDATVPASAGFHGFWHDSITGLGDTPINRSVTELGGQFGGASIGAAVNRSRELLWTVYASADDQEALDWGLRWLTQRLLGSPTGCEGSVAMLRLHDPDPEDLGRGVRVLRSVGLLQPPALVDPDPADCTAVKITFTLVAGDACLYHLDEATIGGDLEVAPVECSDADPDEWECGPVVSISTVGWADANMVERAGVVVEIESPPDACTNDITITLWDDPLKLHEGIVGETPSGVIRVAPIPAGATARVDTLRRRVTVDSGSGPQLRNDLLLLQAGEAPSWVTSRPGGAVVARIAPASLSEIPPGGYTMRVIASAKEGCAQ